MQEMIDEIDELDKSIEESNNSSFFDLKTECIYLHSVFYINICFCNILKFIVK